MLTIAWWMWTRSWRERKRNWPNRRRSRSSDTIRTEMYMKRIRNELSGSWCLWISTSRHYIEEVGKQPLTAEELKWIDYIHKEVVPSMSLFNSSSLGNLNVVFLLCLDSDCLYSFQYDPLCSEHSQSRDGSSYCPYYSRLAEQYSSRKR